ncbi:MAG: hypothetical protein Tsb0021_13110 [Chlamydiales bacterium]
MAIRNKFTLFLFLVFLSSFAFIEAREIYPELTAQQKQQFQQAMQQELRKAEQVLKEQMQQDVALNPAARIEFEALKGALQTKQILVRNFWDAPSIQSPVVREKVLETLRKRFINHEDLFQLENVVQSEKAKMQQS